MKEYDEDEAISYILRNLPEEVASKYDSDDILLIIDLIFDFYEAKGFFDMTDIEDDADDFEEAELYGFVKKALLKDKGNKVDLEDIPGIVHLELEYEDSIADF